MQLRIEIERLVWHIQISQDEDSSMNQHPALGTLCFKYLFLLQLLKALARLTKKQQDDGNLRTKPMSRKADRRNSLRWVFQLPKYAQTEPLFWEQRIQGARAKSQILHMLGWIPSIAKKMCGNHLLCSPGLASNPTSYLLSSFSVYGCSRGSFGACLAPFISGS